MGVHKTTNNVGTGYSKRGKCTQKTISAGNCRSASEHQRLWQTERRVIWGHPKTMWKVEVVCEKQDEEQSGVTNFLITFEDR